MPEIPPLRYLAAGFFRRDYLLPADGQAVIDAPGGNVIYAAAGMAVWENGIGLLGRISPDYPAEWIERFSQAGMNTRGVHRLADPLDLRYFFATESGAELEENPVAAFARRGFPFPKGLLGYHTTPPSLDSRTQLGPLSIRLGDIPADYLDAAAAHLCPMDYLTHSLLTPSLRHGHVTTITLDPAKGYMNPVFWDDIPSIITGLTAFLTSEEKLRNLFQGRSSDLWEMAATLASYGCEMVVIKRGGRGQYVFETGSNKRWILPAYPARVVNPTGAGDAFCGGFLTGWRRSYDPLRAALQGNVSASLTIEHTNAFHAFECMPGLAEARLMALSDMVRTA
ncbi:MAG: carbohydrate kinase family protein [Anaerolineaceae bacterium]|nr:carbohydrate kinase family protein [Anaerolineaceae bacterium]